MTEQETRAKIRAAALAFADTLAAILIEANRPPGHSRRRATIAKCKVSPEHASRADAELRRLKM